jgi:F-type H+-transporting ATPase subunit a
LFGRGAGGQAHRKRGEGFIMEHAIEPQVYSYIHINGKEIPFITDAVAVTWVVMAIILMSALILTRGMKDVPGKRQAAAELLVEFFRNFARGQIGARGKSFAPYLGTLLLFLAVSNLIAIVNFIPNGKTLAALFHNPALEHFEFALHPPTKNFNVTLCLALISIGVVLWTEFRYQGARGWLRSFYRPTPISAFVKVLDYVVRPMSLCLRLFGNILGGLIVMTLIYQAFPLIVPAVFGLYFDLFDGGLQAYVFVFLTSIYLAEAAETEHS